MDYKQVNVDDTDLIEIAEKTIEESSKVPQWLAQGYQPKVYFAEVLNVTDEMEYIEGVTVFSFKPRVLLFLIALWVSSVMH